MASTSFMILRAGLAAVALLLLCSGVQAAPLLGNATCVIENGAIHVRNIPAGVICVGRSDDLSSDAFVDNGSVNFGELVQATSVTVLFFTDSQCLQQDSFVTCTVLTPTFCFIEGQTVIVDNVFSDIMCITRADNISDILFPNGESSVEFAAPALSNDIRLSFFNDTSCINTIQTEPMIFCQPFNGSSTVTPTPTPVPNCPFTVTIPIAVPVTVTVTKTTTSTATSTATPTPTLSGCGLPSGSVCFIQDDRLHLRNLEPSILCVSRSDDTVHFAFPVEGSVDFGLPPQAPVIDITLFADANCSDPVETLPCETIADNCTGTPTPTPTPAATLPPQ